MKSSREGWSYPLLLRLPRSPEDYGKSHPLSVHRPSADQTKPGELKKIFFLLQDVFELLFEDVKPFLDVFEVLATRENDLS